MIIQAIKSQVAKHPDAIALSSDNVTLTYAELCTQVDALAETIGVQTQEAYVGLLADQSAAGVLAMLAVLQAGKTVIPLDTRLNGDLISSMLKPFTSYVLADGSCEQKLAASFTICRIDSLAPTKGDAPAKSVGSAVAPPPAYILHTSGTTGRPKAVIASQVSLSRIALRLAERYYITSDSKVLQFARLSFDSAMVEIYSTLLAGGTIVIPGPTLREDLYETLKSKLRRNEYDIVTLPPSVLLGMQPEEVANLKTLIVAGEACPPQIARKYCERVSHFINAYGPTESIICTATFEVRSLPDDTHVPIGTPLPGVRCMLRDPDTNKQVTEGSGELYISGDMLADGYAYDEQLTSQKFIVDEAGTRWYRSGDIVTMRSDGVMLYNGRLDNQIKVRGQRIELEGVEAAIQAAAPIDKAIVSLMPDGQSLVCMYISEEKQVPAALIRQLQKVLPTYAIPRVYHHVSSMPLDRNGKIDRRALRQSLVEASIPPPVVPEQTAQMVAIWQAILGTAIQDTTEFFDAGGDSLSAMRLLADINATFDTNLTLSQLLDDPVTPEHVTQTIKMKQKG